MLKFKERPEHFIVNEFSKFEFKEKGKYGIFTLHKHGLNTYEAIQTVATKLHVKPNTIGFAGNKDKKAITFQFISIPGKTEKDNLQLSRINLTFLGFLDKPIKIGDLTENQFVLRVTSDTPPVKNEFIPNYFDEQRFSDENANIGEAIVKKDFKKVVELIQKSDESFFEASQEHLSAHPNEFVGVLSIVPKPLMLLYIHSFQSMIFNKALSQIIKEKTKDYKEIEIAHVKLAFPTTELDIKDLPIPGFATTFTKEEKIIFEPILEEYKIRLIDFIIPQLKWLSQDGTKRKGIVKLRELNIIRDTATGYQVTFYLPKGSYATIALKALF